MKINLKGILVMLPLLALLAGCATNGDNQGGVGTDVGAAMGSGNGPGPGNALDIDNSGVGVTRSH